MSFTDVYAKFRGSTGFLYFLCGSIAGAALAHRFLGFDPDWGITNLSLSMEASISVALLIMANEKQEAAQRRQLEYMLHLLESQQHILERFMAERIGGNAGGRAVAAQDMA